MKRILQLCLLLAVVLCMTTSLSLAQAPTGAISGVVSDETGAVIPNASVVIKNKATDFDRRLTTGADGTFSAAALPAGQYEVRVEAKGFRTLVREATVEVGSTTTANMGLSVGQTTEVVNVEAATAQIAYDTNTIEGVITRKKIQELPLNGRSFLNLASLEPGVRVNTGSTSQYNAQFSVSVLGASAGRTAYNVDGGNVRDSIENSGTSMNFSQEVVQEFQLSSVNFDLSTGITAVGSVNIVTRSGGNQFHGSGYFFFRDHNMAAYPGLQRNPLALDPFFVRRNPGFWIGGPIIKDKLF
ncbi:MAG TPA: carboxypeptidase-like regulatory domain-containing protein, partial [Bryobacteraceae bacterium]|nr:carboxypeptidase-like regulatory domain-containing protein [Bryobacteraceae bacterium]